MKKLYILSLLSILLSSCWNESGDGVNNYYTATNVYSTTDNQVLKPASWGMYLALNVDKWLKADDEGKEDICNSIYPNLNIFASSDTVVVKLNDGTAAFIYVTNNKSIEDVGTSWVYGHTSIGRNNKITERIFDGCNTYKIKNIGTSQWKISVDKLAPNRDYDFSLNYICDSNNINYELTGSGRFESYNDFKFNIVNPLKVKFDYNKYYGVYNTINYYNSGEIEIQVDNYVKQPVNVKINSKNSSIIDFKNESNQFDAGFSDLSSMFYYY